MLEPLGLHGFENLLLTRLSTNFFKSGIINNIILCSYNHIIGLKLKLNEFCTEHFYALSVDDCAN